MTREDLVNDLAYARRLAEEGRHAPLLGGAYLIFWGVLNSVAFGLHWSILTGAAPRLGGSSFAILWTAYGVLAAIGMVFLRTRGKDKPGLGSVGGRAERAIWNGAGLALAAVAVGSIVRLVLDQDITAPNAILGAAFAIYGAALLGVAKLSEQNWLSAYAALSIGVAALLCAFANQPWAYLAAAAGALLVLAAPGVVLMRREPPPLA